MELTPVSDTEDLSKVTPVVRYYLAQRVKGVIEGLEPYVDGSLGPVSAQLVNSYLKAVRELGALYHAYRPVAPVVEEPEVDQEAVTAANVKQLREKVLGSLAEIEAKGRRQAS